MVTWASKSVVTVNCTRDVWWDAQLLSSVKSPVMTCRITTVKSVHVAATPSGNEPSVCCFPSAVGGQTALCVKLSLDQVESALTEPRSAKTPPNFRHSGQRLPVGSRVWIMDRSPGHRWLERPFLWCRTSIHQWACSTTYSCFSLHLSTFPPGAFYKCTYLLTYLRMFHSATQLIWQRLGGLTKQ